MKMNYSNRFLGSIILLFVMIQNQSCVKSGWDEEFEVTHTIASKNPKTENLSLVVVPFFIEDADFNNPVTGHTTQLYTLNGHKPILAPDGHYITLGEFNEVTGTASVKCISSGTQVKLHLRNLIPKGVYTIWSLTFRTPGFDGTFESFSNLTGLGSLGTSDGSSNSFVASASGEGQITRIIPPGNLSAFGSIGSCILDDEFEVHFVGAYHIDGLTYGATPGPGGTYIEQFGFIFRNQMN